MVHYIRFLRTPQVSEVPKKGFSITCVATVTTDLGDSFFGQDAELVAELVDATGSGDTLVTHKLSWRDGDRAIKLNMSVSAKLSPRLVRFHITTQDTIETTKAFRMPRILDVWSKPFSLKNGSRTEALVERRLLLFSKCVVRQWEETGDSIARHIWDASLGFVILLQQIFSAKAHQQLSILQERLCKSVTTRLRVLEVGAGCGLVGIALAQLRKAQVVLTDLEDAQNILRSNVACASLVGGSSVHHQVLEWGPSIAMLSEPDFDLVLVSDCIYNPDSSLLLVETLIQVSKHNPHITILVGFKRRHDADDIFFARMRDAGFHVAESCEVLLPHTMTDYDVAEPQVEMFVYQASTSV